MSEYYVYDGETSTGIDLGSYAYDCDVLYVYSGGTANDIRLNPWGWDGNFCSLCVSEGGIANYTAVNPFGNLYVFSGGAANDTTVNDNGRMYVCLGGTANYTTVNCAGCMYVSYGGIAHDVTILAGGQLGGFSWNETRHWDAIENGSAVVADNVVIVGNSMHVSSGGVANETTVTYRDYLAEGGRMYVSSGGTANYTTVTYSGYMYVSEGGVANETTLNRGQLYVYAGGVANALVTYDYGSAHIYVGGELESATMNGGDLYIYGAAAEIAMYGGWLNIFSGGIASSVTVYNNREGIFINSDGILNGADVRGGTVRISSGGTAIDTIVDSYGSMYVSDGGRVTGSLAIADGGYVYAYAGSIIDFDLSETSVDDEARVNDLSLINGTPDYTVTVCANQARGVYALAGNAAAFGSAVSLTVGEDTYADALTVGETYTVGNRDYLLGIDDDDTLTLSVFGAPVETYKGEIPVSAAEVMTGKEIVFGGDEDAMIVGSGGTALETVVDADGILTVYDGGVAKDTYVNGDYDDDDDFVRGSMYVSEGGVASGTTVAGGELGIENGGFAYDTVLEDHGYFYVDDSGTAVGITVDGGYVEVWGTADDVVVNAGGYVEVYGTATAITENGGYVYADYDAEVTFTANTFSDVVLDGASATVHSGTVADGTVVSGYEDDEEWRQGGLYVYDGGVAKDTAVYGRGELRVDEGGIASGTTLSGYYDEDAEEWRTGELYVDEGAVASDTTVEEGGYMEVHDGGVANDTTVCEGGSMGVGGVAKGITIDGGYVELDGTVDDIVVNEGGYVDVDGTATAIKENGGYVYIRDGADEVTFVANTFSDVWLEGTSATVHSGTVAVDTEVRGCYDDNEGEWRDGELCVYDGGVANGTVLSGYYDYDEQIGGTGYLFVYDGGVANDTAIYDEGYLCVSEGGVANNTTVDEGGYLKVDGAANGITVDGGYANITGAAEDVVVNQGGYVDVYGTATAVKENGGYVNADDADEVTFVANTFSDLELYGDGASVHAGTVAKNITVSGYYDKYDELWQGGLDVYAGGVANCVTVDDGGLLWIDKGGKFTGTLTVSKGAEVCLQEGSIVDFDITAVAPGSAALINDWSLVNDHGVSYTVTTADKQKTGVYALAGGAAEFDACITVNTAEGETLGEIEVDGDELVTEKYIYSLGIVENTLSLTVEFADTEPPVKPIAKADITTATNQNVTVTATFSDDSAVKEYSLDNKTWKNYTTGVVFAANGTAYFRAADEAGNVSDATTYKVANIDPSMAPTGKPVSGETSADKPAVTYKTELDASGLYTVTGKFGAVTKGTVTILDGVKKVASGSIKAGVLTFKKDALLDGKTTYTVEIKNTDKKSAGAAFSWTLTAKELFTKGDNSDDTLKGAKTLAANSTANDWVGYGDAVDYYKLGVNAAGGIYDLSLSGVKNNVKLTVYTKNGTKVKTVTASAKKPSIPLADLCLDSGSYAVIEAPKAAKAQNSDYALKLTEKATFKRSNNDWSHAEALTADATFTGALTKAAGGDTVDYCDVSALGSLSFKTTAGKVKVSFYDTNKQAIKVAVKTGGKDKTAAAVSLTSGKVDNLTIGTLPGSVKYLKIEAAGKTLNSYTIGKIA